MGNSNSRRGDLAARTHCINNHEFTPENTYWRKNGRGRACRECVRIAGTINKKKQRATVEYKEREAERSRFVRAKIRGLSSVEVGQTFEELVKRDSLSYLKLQPVAAKASDDFNYQVDRVKQRPPCEADPGRWIDYDRPGGGGAPSAVQAALYCDGCPFWQQCSDLADATKPILGVWASSVWIPSNSDKSGTTGIKRDK